MKTMKKVQIKENLKKEFPFIDRSPMPIYKIEKVNSEIYEISYFSGKIQKVTEMEIIKEINSSVYHIFPNLCEYNLSITSEEQLDKLIDRFEYAYLNLYD